MMKCAVLTCTNEADPRWFTYDANGGAVAICDGHDPTPRADEVAIRPPEPSAQALAERIIRGYVATTVEVECIARALITAKGET